MSKIAACFICGTDTDVGKTIVCSGLLKNLPDAQVLKVIQTGRR
ncbi:AAA family ATPase [Zophobihabitans entericus]|uniref:Dethiobiotin synthase n=1 Tax=Zophobihabitans entericus TaxID=1635327 RepID=A0A6G9IB44_9GAMM|nr:AAA family ATPase [Zophobihabitans entericus]QIQ20944.1 dethiobiotin synthase [Zophobihabitans entericus]